MIIFRERASTVLYEVLSTLEYNAKFLLPVNICPIVPETFLRVGIKFDFIDINLKTLCMDEDLAIKAIKYDSSITGILIVNTFGIQVKREVFFQKLKYINPDLFIIYDKCHSIQNFDFKPNESLAKLTLFSSGYSKYVDMGYGGFGFLKDDEFSETFRDNTNDSDFRSYQKAVISEIYLMRKHKASLNKIYKQGIPSHLHLGENFENWRFSILIDNKEELLKLIFQKNDLFASSHFHPIDHKYSNNPIKNSNAQIISSKIVNLFNDFRFNEKKAKRIVKILNKFLTENEENKA